MFFVLATQRRVCESTSAGCCHSLASEDPTEERTNLNQCGGRCKLWRHNAICDANQERQQTAGNLLIKIFFFFFLWNLLQLDFAKSLSKPKTW